MKIAKLFLAFVAIAGLTYQITWMSQNRILPNFHEVIPNELYRSAQLFPQELESKIKQYQIKTVVNLRGAQTSSQWYRDEKAIADKLQIQLIDIGMGTHHVPHKAELAKLIEVFKTAPKPMLVHCRVGADRTGEAIALYEMINKNASRDKALENLSVKFLHVSLFVPSKTLFVENFSGEQWALQTYDPCKEPFKSYYLEGDCK